MRVFTSTLAEVRSGLQSLSGLCLDELNDAEVRVAARDLEGLRRMLDSVATSVARRLVSGCGRDGRAVLARSFDVAPTEAGRLQRQAQVVEAFPGAAALLAEGLVSPEHVRCLQPLVGSAVEHQHVVEKAVGTSVSEFGRIVAEALIGGDYGEGLVRKQHEARYLTFGRNPLGMITVNGALPESFGLRFSGRLKAMADQAWREANPTRPSALQNDAADTYGQRLCDALERLFTNPHTSGIGAGGASIVLTVDVDDGSAEVVGHGPVASSTALTFLGRPDTRLFVAQTRSGGREVVDGKIATVARGSKLFQTVTRDGVSSSKQLLQDHLAKVDPSILDSFRHKRKPTLSQRLVVVLRDHRCVVPGCEQAFDRCEIHHVDDYDDGGPTIVANLVLLCKAHHHWLHNNKHTLKPSTSGWIVVGTDGLVIARPPPRPAA